MTIPQKTPPAGDIMEQVILKGDLGKLTPDERVQYYQAVCRSIGLNPLTRPLEYMVLQGKQVLYARRDAADQLRKLNGISVNIVDQLMHDNLLTIHVKARDQTGREDEDLGVVSFVYPERMKDRQGNWVNHPKAGKPLEGEERANSILKCVTKAKRRVTLSISGLGFPDVEDEDEVPIVRAPPQAAPNVMHAPETGEITQSAVDVGETPPSSVPATADAAPPASSTGGAVPQSGRTAAEDWTMDECDAYLATAAQKGMEHLERAWTDLTLAQRKALKIALERRHKVTAMVVDDRAAEEKTQQQRSNAS